MRTLILLSLTILLGTSLSAYADPTTLWVQKKLKALGLYHGTVNGTPGSKTNAAIRRYQIRKGLTITGELNEETLRCLKLRPSAEPPLPPIPSKVTLAWLFEPGPMKTASQGAQIKMLQRAQHNLRLLGYYKGPVDGVLSNTFIEALRLWQHEVGLKKTAQLDNPALEGLYLIAFITKGTPRR